ncbi:MAG: hypothetical protein SNJ71_00625 [Bacteroidales bacterium]
MYTENLVKGLEVLKKYNNNKYPRLFFEEEDEDRRIGITDILYSKLEEEDKIDGWFCYKNYVAFYFE